MKAYGFSKSDNVTCKYGCCESKTYGKHRNCKKKASKSRKKRARRIGKTGLNIQNEKTRQ